MDIQLEPGKYVVAVSGGVDSVALLHLLAQMQSSSQSSELPNHTKPIHPQNIRLIVAHYDHGIREDSVQDRKLVQELAKQYGLPFVYHTGKLGPKTSEAQARAARYAFLHQVRMASKARAIITAHHQDDLLETVILNLLRGTGRRGLSSLKSIDVVKRPLLQIPKKELLRYASREGLRWREDSTNSDVRYRRNYIRAHIMPRFAGNNREALSILSRWAAKQNTEISEQIGNYLHLQPASNVLDRHSFVMLPHAVAREIMAEWLLLNSGAELSKKLLERLVVAGKTGRSGSKVNVDAGHWLCISAQTLALKPTER